MPKKLRGLYVCDPAADGKHGDTFDSGKLANWALRSGGLTTVIPFGFGTFQGGGL
jgi:hypothetical protein